MTASGGSVVGLEAVQRRTVAVLVVAQMVGGLSVTIGIAVASVLARRISGSDALAGLVQTAQVVGAAAASYVLGRLMGRRGRRVGLASGYVVGAVGGGVCILGGVLSSFPVLLVGGLLLGSNSATAYQSRYAAADLAEPHHRARALALVLWATTFGAVLGPNLVGPAGDLAAALGLPTLTGPYLVSLLGGLVAAGVLTVLLRPDPLLTARGISGVVEQGASAAGSWRAVVELGRRRPALPAAVLGMAAAQAVMVSVMVMTPLHMDHGGAELRVIGFVISVHVLGMFFFSPVVGALTDRLGSPRMLLAGSGLLWLSTWLSGTSPTGSSARIVWGLFLLGLGWSCCTVAASALITAAAPLEQRTDVQGTADLVMNVAAALAGGLAGVVVDLRGFGTLNALAAVLVLGAVVAAVRAGRDPALARG